MGEQKKRNFGMDVLRIVAMYLVIHQHCAEQFYAVSPTGTAMVGDDTFWIGINTSLGRVCVPLFTMISGYFLLPMKLEFTSFFKRRFTRVLIPFVVWSIIYAFFAMPYYGQAVNECLSNIMNIPITFNPLFGHLWYVYMLIGLYLLIPIISPWVENCSKKQMRLYLIIWAFTSLYEYFKGVEIGGQCFWNPSPTFYYFYGMAGYLLLGYYVKKYGALSIANSILVIILSYIPTAYFFIHNMYAAPDYAVLEMSWNFCSLNVVAMTYAVFCLFTHIKSEGNTWAGRFVSDYARGSYGVYLFHVIVMLLTHDFLLQLLPDWYVINDAEGYTANIIYDCVPRVLFAVPLNAIVCFVVSYAVVKLLRFFPKADKILGV